MIDPTSEDHTGCAFQGGDEDASDMAHVPSDGDLAAQRQGWYHDAFRASRETPSEGPHRPEA